MEKLAMFGGTPIRSNLLGYGHQSISDEDINAVVEVLKSDFLTCGPTTTQFEEDLKRITGAKYVTVVANGTAALHVACLAAGVSSGDEVIVSSITFAASANCVLYCGGIPIFADIDPKTWNISPASIENLITPKTKAIIAVDFGGVHVDSEAIRKICDEKDLIFIEDAAHSLGTVYKGHPVGSIADITTFSFHPVKTITTGEGGAIATNSSLYEKRIKLFAKHGITRDATLMRNPNEGGWYYEQLELGYNYRMSDIQAALGSSQLKRLEDFKLKRQGIVDYYDSEFENIPEVKVQFDDSPSDTSRHLYCLKFDLDKLNTTRKFIYDAMKAEGIGVNVHYLPVYRLPFYKELGYQEECCPEANDYYEKSLTIPLHCDMDINDAEDVVNAVKKIVNYLKEQSEE